MRRSAHIMLLLALWMLVSCSEKSNTLSSSGFGSGDDRLLSDAELRTEEDPNAPDEEPAWTDWIADHNEPIRSITSSYFQDLQFLKPLIGDRRFVQLGENSHGVAQYNMVKTRLVKFLHEEMDFDVIAFESGMFECYNGNEKKAELEPLELMTTSINSVWHTVEVLELFEYIHLSAQTGDPLVLAGFDILMPVGSDISGRPAFFRAVIAAVDPGYADSVYDVDSTFIHQRDNYDDFKTYIDENRTDLLAFYTGIMSFIDDHAAELAAAFPHDPSKPRFVRQMAQSTKRYIDRAHYDYIGDTEMNLVVRDLGMAENADFLLDEAYPDKKIIGWAHNFHVSHDGEHIEGATFEVPESMGSYLVREHRDEMYTIGLYMYRGQASFYHVNVYDITPATEGSLESIMYRCRRKFCFVDMLYEDENAGNSWMFRETVAKYWGTMPHRMILRNQYDGILFVDTVTPVVYVTSGLSAVEPVFPTIDNNRMADQ